MATKKKAAPKPKKRFVLIDNSSLLLGDDTTELIESEKELRDRLFEILDDDGANPSDVEVYEVGRKLTVNYKKELTIK